MKIQLSSTKNALFRFSGCLKFVQFKSKGPVKYVMKKLSRMIMSIIKEILFVASFWILFLSVIIYLFRNKSKYTIKIIFRVTSKGIFEDFFFSRLSIYVSECPSFFDIFDTLKIVMDRYDWTLPAVMSETTLIKIEIKLKGGMG